MHKFMVRNKHSQTKDKRESGRGLRKAVCLSNAFGSKIVASPNGKRKKTKKLAVGLDSSHFKIPILNFEFL